MEVLYFSESQGQDCISENVCQRAQVGRVAKLALSRVGLGLVTTPVVASKPRPHGHADTRLCVPRFSAPVISGRTMDS